MTKANRPTQPAAPLTARPGWPLAGLTGRILALMAGALGTAWAQTTGELAIPNYLGGPSSRDTPPATTRQDAADPAEKVRVGTGQPYRAPRVMPRQRYNVRIGLASANFWGSLNTTYTDNIFAAQSGQPREGDLSLFPMLGISLGLPLSERQVLRVDVGVGYRISLSHSELNAFTLSPSSSTDYRLIIGDVLVTFFDRVSSVNNPPPQVAGAAGGVGIDFAQINNQAGMAASWLIDSVTSVSAGYTYQLSRAFNEQFSLLDFDGHQLTAGIYRQLHPYWTAGLGTSYGWTTFSQGIQNGSTTWSVSPVLAFEPSPFLNISVTVGYSSATFDQSGTIGDSATFGGLTYSGSVTHTITRDLNHTLTFGSGINSGIGANFSEFTSLDYGIRWTFHPKMSLHGGLGWNHFKQSGSTAAFLIIPGPNGPTGIPITVQSSATGDVYRFTLGTGYRLSQKLSAGLSYAYLNQKNSPGDQQFDQHTISLNLSYSF